MTCNCKQHNAGSCSCHSRDGHHEHRKGRCFIQHIPQVEINPVGQSVTIPTVPSPIFKDFTKNHHKLLVNINTTATAGASAVIIFTPRCGPAFTEPLVGGVLQGTSRNQFFEVEDMQKIEIQASAVNAVTFTANIYKTFCICCPS
jgi:hypothetical protein